MRISIFNDGVYSSCIFGDNRSKNTLFFLEYPSSFFASTSNYSASFTQIERWKIVIRMVQIKEFRILMPMSLKEYQIAHLYVSMKMQQKTTTENEGVEIIEDRPFKDDVYGKGQYTCKHYRLQSKLPAWITGLAPPDALVVQEEAWNAYPICKSVLKCSYFPKFQITIETVHRADKGESENVHGLSEEQLAARQVEIIDIASTDRDYWSFIVGRCSVDLSKFKSSKTDRGPLLEGWQDNQDPVMTAYKLVTVDAPYWGFGYRVEQTLIAAERALFHESHKNCFAWIDEWFGLTLEQIREIHQSSQSLTQKRDLEESCSNGG